ncbi:MAG: hypothetical protein OHK0022_07280 [Roseiflexaceae bacterium]
MLTTIQTAEASFQEQESELMLTTAQAAEILAHRGHIVKADTVKHWCQRGLFPGAERIGNTRRGLWRIPQVDIDAFTPPRLGRPPKRMSVTTNSQTRCCKSAHKL